MQRKFMMCNEILLCDNWAFTSMERTRTGILGGSREWVYVFSWKSGNWAMSSQDNYCQAHGVLLEKLQFLTLRRCCTTKPNW